MPEELEQLAERHYKGMRNLIINRYTLQLAVG